MVQTRNPYIDIMRALGLLMIFISHSAPSADAVMQLRCFDVPMMIFISGLTFSNKTKQDFNYWNYLKKRTTRLVFPVWLFLAGYFIALSIAQTLGVIPHYLTNRMAVESFLLYKGIGYVWIFRVFLLIMLLSPLLAKISSWSNKSNALIILLLLALVELLVYVTTRISNTSIIFYFINEVLVYALGYSVLFIVGIKMRNAEVKDLSFWGIFTFVLSMIALIIYVKTQGLPIRITPFYKFPPRSYFLIYGMLASVLIWTSRNFWGKFLNINLLRFMGQNTIWIYLWHIPFVLLCSIIDMWFLRFLVLLIIPFCIYKIQFSVVEKLSLNPKLKQILIG